MRLYRQGAPTGAVPADGLEERPAPGGVGVVLQADHRCMTRRGVQAPGPLTVTSAVHRLLRTDGRSDRELLSLAGVRA